ncbi:hypothetical protein E1B28_007918 [Marasmius oreades]|uniref:Uncharacterized protein n=1 Tax=Marasmius oreades TaxID=181124 RepID=A0A9P7S2L9_9AGAR|nr:uncharacterized protein E1B28_007918 [Marasmius oreades]KAG7094316.1 hypothetical protein E1B28_007918 [Marasmius oreades]
MHATSMILPVDVATPPLAVGDKNDKKPSRRMSQPNLPSFTMTYELLPQTHFTSETHRQPSPASSIRATYVRSRPPSYIDLLDQSTPATIGDLAKLQEDVERDLESWGALANERLPQPPLFLHRKPRTGRRSPRGSNGVDSDSISILTTCTTTSTMHYRPRRNAEASPPLLRNSEMGRPFPLVEPEQEMEAKDSEKSLEEGTPTKRWNGPSRLRERLGSLLWKSKEHTGILDRDHTETADGVETHTKSKKIRRHFKMTAKGPSDSLSAAPFKVLTPIKGDSDMARKGSLSSRRPHQKQESEGSESTISTGKSTLRRSRSFAGFRESTITNTLCEADAVDSEEIDEITKEAAGVNVNVRKTFSYEQEESD